MKITIQDWTTIWYDYFKKTVTDKDNYKKLLTEVNKLPISRSKIGQKFALKTLILME